MNFESTGADVTYAFVDAFVEALIRAGLVHVCISPGSRSSPLAMLFAARARQTEGEFHAWSHVDERSAGFFALGLAKSLRQPVGLVCTSGTAAANFLPAIVEARQARVPLVVLTADRPPELRDFGAAQSIDQINLYGKQVKWFVEVALPDTSDDLMRYVRALGRRAVISATEDPAGPVHLNFPFREPLTPKRQGSRIKVQSAETSICRVSDAPVQDLSFLDASSEVLVRGRATPDATAIRQVADELSKRERGLIVCGALDEPEFPPAVSELARALGYPILADPLSQVRCGPHDRSLVVDSYDAFLRDRRLAETLLPDAIIRFGAMPLSKPLATYLRMHDGVHVLVTGAGVWDDPFHLATRTFRGDPVGCCEALASVLACEGTSANRSWTTEWIELARCSRKAIDESVRDDPEPSEARVFLEMADQLPAGATLYAGSSMPIRDLDTFFASSERPIRFLGNRGANGIDGLVSSALGASAGGASPLILVLGDLSFYHDMNGLLAARRYPLSATIIVLNNDGGGIFEFLPQANFPDVFEEYFATPHGLDFKRAVEMYGGRFHRFESWQGFRSLLESAISDEGLDVIEVRTNRRENVRQHQTVWNAVSEAAGNRGGPAS